MATSTKDVKLTLSVETLGEEDIKALQAAIQKLATGGSAAAPEFQRLADQIDRLGEQNEALQTFKSLSDEVDELAAKQAQAAIKANDLRTALEGQKAAVVDVRSTLEQANTTLLEGQKAYVEAGNAVRLLKAESDSAAKGTAAYATELAGLVKRQNDARLALVEMRSIQSEANRDANEAVSAQGKLQTAYNSAAKQADAVTTALTRQQEALQQSVTTADALGVATLDVASAEANLLAAFNEVGTAARRRTAETEEMAEADRLLVIQERALAAMYAESQQELNALVLAQVDAVASVRDYERAKAQATDDAQRWQREADGIVDAAQAAQQLARQTQVAVEAARELAAAAAFEKAAADSQKLLKAAEYVRFWEQALEDGGTEAQRAAAAAVAAAEKIEQAFRTTGVRSVESLNAEIAELRAAMGTLQAHATATGSSLSGAFTQGQSRIEALQRELRELNGTLTTSDRLAGLFKNSMGQIAAGNLIADGIGYLVNKVKELAAAFVETIARSQALTRALNAIYKDSQTAAAQIDFLRRTAFDAGVAVGGIEKAFVKFSASTQSANIPLQQSNELFSALVKAGGTLGLSSDNVSGALEALSQMASKGTVSMEELRQQLGDRLPGALSLVEKGLQLTDGELIKLVESGGLAARDLFPALTTALRTMHGEVTGITPAWENFKNILSGVATDAGDSGWATLLEGAVKVLGGTVGLVAYGLSEFSERAFTAGRAALVMFETLRGNGKEALAFFNEELLKSNNRLEAQRLRLQQLVAPTEENAARLKELSNQQVAQGSSAQVAAAGTQKLREVMASTAEGQKALQAAMGATATTYVATVVQLLKLIDAADKQAESATKSVKAAQDEGNALVALAKLRGDERAELEASVRAKEMEFAAQQKVSDAKQREAELLNVQKALLIDTANARGLTQKQLANESTALDVKITKAEAEAAQAKGSLSSLRLEVAARQTAVKTYGDQSAAIDTLQRAMVAAEATAQITRQGQKDGLFTMEQVRNADIAAAQARGQYNNALQDSVGKIQAVASVEQARINVQMAGLNVAQNAYNLLAQSSRASGDYAMAIYYEIEAKRVQIQITRLQAEAKQKEAQAELLSIDATRKALEAQGPLNEAKKLELEARTLNAKAKLIEAGASTDIIRALEAEVVAIRNRGRATAETAGNIGDSTNVTNQHSGAVDRNTSSINSNVTALERQAAASERAAEAERKRLNVDKEGFSTDKNGQRIVAGSDIMTRTGMLAFLKSAGVDDEQVALNIIKQATDSQGNVVYNNNPLQVKHGGTTLSNALLKEAEAYTFGAKLNKPKTNGSTTQTTPTKPVETTKSTTHTVNLNFGGRTTTVNTSSADDAEKLANFMRSLEQAASTAS